MNEKWILHSWTVVFNVLVMLFAIAEPLQAFLHAIAGVPELAPAARIIALLLGAVNILLRMKTVVPVRVLRPRPEWWK